MDTLFVFLLGASPWRLTCGPRLLWGFAWWLEVAWLGIRDHMGVALAMGVPQNRWFVRENPNG